MMKVLLHEKEEMDVVCLYESCDNESERQKNEQIQNNKVVGARSSKKAFPWLVTFDKVIHSSIGKKSFHLLKRLLSVYVNNITKTLEANYIMTYEVIKLKKHLKNTLTFFHFYWHDINEHTSNYNTYLNKISVLLAIYIDMELRTSKRSKNPSKVAAKLFNALWIYLNKSEEHIFKALLRIKLITKRYTKICDPIFRKSFTSLKTNQDSMTGIKYVRCLLLLKLWRKIKEDARSEKNVDELAVKILGSYMPKMDIDLLSFLPKPPLNCKNETLWLMQPNLFDLKQACNDLITFEEKIEREIADYTEPSAITKITETCNYNNLKINSNTMEDKMCTMNPTSNKIQKIDFNENGLFQVLFQYLSKENNYSIKNNNREKVNKIKKSKFLPTVKSGEIIVIDLSKEDEESISPNIRKKNKCKKNVGRLRIMTKRCKAQKNIKYEQQIEISDVCSTDNSVDLKRIDHSFNDKDNKNFKHIENISFLKKEKSLNNGWYMDSKQECAVNKNCDHSLLSSKEEYLSNLLLIALKLIGQNTKDSASLLNILILQEYKEKNLSLQNSTFNDKDSNITKLLAEISKNGLIKTQLNEMQLKMDHNSTKNIDNYENEGMNEYKENYSLGTTIFDKDLQTIELIKQNLFHDINLNSNYCDKIGVNTYNNSDYFNLNKTKETVPDTTYHNEPDAKPIFDKKTVSILSDLERCMQVLGRISKHFMDVHIKKPNMKCLSEKTDSCADSTTVVQDQVTESLNQCILQNLNALNAAEIHKILKLSSNTTEHIVNPNFIKACVEDKTLYNNKPNSEVDVEWYSQEMANITDTSVMKKSELYDNKKRSIGRCADIVAFGLNAKEEENLDLFALDDNGSTSMLSSTCSSTLLIPSDVNICESTEYSPKFTSNDTRMEQVYDFQEVDILKEFGSKTDAIDQTLMNDGCTWRDIPSNVLNYFPIQTEDRAASPYYCTSVYPLQLGLESLQAEQLIETPNLLLPFGQHDFTLYNPMLSDSQSIFTENDNLTTQQFVHELQSIEPYELIQQNIKLSSDNQLYTDQRETSQVSLTSHVSMDRERLSKVIENSNNLWKQVELPNLSDALPLKKRILMNFQGKPIPSIILNNSMGKDHPITMITDGVSRDTNLLYKVESKGNILISTEKLCLKSSNENITRSDTQISKVPAVNEKSMEEISTKISISPNIRRLDITSFNGETSVKRRKVTSKLLPLLDTGRLIYSTNTQTQGKDLLFGIKDFSSTSNTNHTIV